MNSDSSDSEDCNSEKNSNQRFVNPLAKYKILFNKSQVPKIKNDKDKAILELQNEYKRTFGKELTVKQLKKKMQNIKNEIKKKKQTKKPREIKKN